MAGLIGSDTIGRCLAIPSALQRKVRP